MQRSGPRGIGMVEDVHKNRYDSSQVLGKHMQDERNKTDKTNLQMEK